MKTLWADLETFSSRDVKNGPHQYAEDCYVLLFGYAIDDEPAKVWDLTVTETMPEDLRAALADPEVNTVWHNGANFDVPVLRKRKTCTWTCPLNGLMTVWSRPTATACPVPWGPCPRFTACR